MANITETGTNGATGHGTWDFHAGLTDGTTDGKDVYGKVKCGISSRGSTPRAFFYMKLAKPSTVMKLQLAFRTDKTQNRKPQIQRQSTGKNVRIQVGTSPQYNVNDPVCTEIAQLSGTGLVEYECSQFHAGQYVIISNDQAALVICEAKVFVNDAGKGGYKDYQSNRSN